MPSLNYYAELGKGHHVRVNVCEGQVCITEEIKGERGKYNAVGASIRLDRAQAEALAKTILAGLENGY